MDIGAKIRELREARQCTQVQLSKMCGWTQPQMARIEASPTQLTVTTLIRVANALGLALEVTFESVGESKLPIHQRNEGFATGTLQRKAAIKLSRYTNADAASWAYWERRGIAL